MTGIRSILTSAFLLLLTAPAWAHPGHPTVDPNHSHSSFDMHLLTVSALIVLALTSVAVLRRILRRSRSKL